MAWWCAARNRGVHVLGHEVGQHVSKQSCTLSTRLDIAHILLLAVVLCMYSALEVLQRMLGANTSLCEQPAQACQAAYVAGNPL